VGRFRAGFNWLEDSTSAEAAHHTMWWPIKTPQAFAGELWTALTSFWHRAPVRRPVSDNRGTPSKVGRGCV